MVVSPLSGSEPLSVQHLVSSVVEQSESDPGLGRWHPVSWPYANIGQLEFDQDGSILGVGYPLFMVWDAEGKSTAGYLKEWTGNLTVATDGKIWMVGTAPTSRNPLKRQMTVSADRGLGWQTVSLPTNQDLLDICFIDEQSGMVSADRDEILVTSDGGETWTVRPYDLGESVIHDGFEYLRFVSAERGWAVDEYSERSCLFHLRWRVFLEPGPVYGNPV